MGFPEFVVQPGRLLHESRARHVKCFCWTAGCWQNIRPGNGIIGTDQSPSRTTVFHFRLVRWAYQYAFSVGTLRSKKGRNRRPARLRRDGRKEIDGQPLRDANAGVFGEYDPEMPWLERVEDQVDRVQRVFEEINPNLVERNPTLGGRPIKSLLPNLLLLANAITDEKGNSWQITEATRLLNKEVRELARKQVGGRVGKANEYFTYHFTGEEKIDKELGARVSGCSGRSQIPTHPRPRRLFTYQAGAQRKPFVKVLWLLVTALG